jgi:hypothetical protein
MYRRSGVVMRRQKAGFGMDSGERAEAVRRQHTGRTATHAGNRPKVVYRYTKACI